MSILNKINPKKQKQEQVSLNANHFLNIRAIDNNFLYTIDRTSIRLFEDISRKL